jgi:hypothetical protein
VSRREVKGKGEKDSGKEKSPVGKFRLLVS